MKITQAVRDYQSAIGSIGGKAGIGQAKQRSRAHYIRIGKLSAEKRKSAKSVEIIDQKQYNKLV